MGTRQKMSENPKIPLIIDCALSLLRDKGYGGCSMRQVATNAGISLSNVQFYFKNKDELLRAMVDFYFQRCTLLFDNHLDDIRSLAPAQKIRAVISFGLEAGSEVSELCKIFRELWAIETRNEDVRKDLETYYKGYQEKVAAAFAFESVDACKVEKVTSLLLPYFDGYPIMATVLPLNKDQVVDMLANIVSRELGIETDTTQSL